MSDRPKQYKAKVLAVASGKGGVGKTNLAANLSIYLARMGKQVMLVDADLSLGNLDVILNIQSKYTLAHVVSGRKSMEEVVHMGPEEIEVVCAASGMEELANLSKFHQARLIRELSALALHSDIVIVDTAAGIARSVTSFCLAADHVLVVTTPDATAMTDAYGMIKVLVRNDYQGQINLVVNMVDTLSQGKQIYLQMASVARQFLSANLYYAGAVLHDAHVVSAVRTRKPVVLAYPKSPASLSIGRLATRIGNVPRSRMEGPAFFKKVVNWFS
jgi:flagellar biosynthesis protein FlhG